MKNFAIGSTGVEVDNMKETVAVAYREAKQQLKAAAVALKTVKDDRDRVEAEHDQLVAQHGPRLLELERQIAAIEEHDGKKAAKQSAAWEERRCLKDKIAAAKKQATVANAVLKVAKQALEQQETAVRLALLELCRTPLVHEELDSELTAAVKLIASLSVIKSRMGAATDERCEFLRLVIEAAPTGHTTAHIDPERVYKAWLNLSGKVGAYLQLSPSYYYELAELLRRFTLENLQAAGALKIDRKPLEAAAKAGTLKDCKGELVTAEMLEETFLHFDADAFTPKVQPIISEQPLTDLVSDFHPGDLRPLEESGLEPQQIKLIKEHTGATTVQDVMSLPAAKLAAIPGIGPVGYAKILRGVSGKPHHPAI